MYSTKPGLILGFHGCDQIVCDAIVNNKLSLNPSLNDYDWLGNGMYFWENNIKRALQFAEEQKSKPPPGRPLITVPAVLGAVLNLGTCLDLLDSEYLEIVKESYKSLSISYKTYGIEMPKNKRVKGSNDLLIRKLDCAVIENVHRMTSSKKFDSVKGVFVEGGELYPEAGFNEKNHIQICIRNPNCIKGYFFPRPLATNWDKV